MSQSRLSVLVCDNAPCHNHLEDLFLEPAYQGGRLLRLAPYSPILNPIENVWSKIKADVKQELRSKHDALVRGDPNEQQSMQEWRMVLLQQAVIAASKAVSSEQCARFVEHVEKTCMKVISNDGPW